jgi:hypothetical protein
VQEEKFKVEIEKIKLENITRISFVLLLMSVVLGECCTTSLILRIQDVCKSEELKVSEKEKICIKITKYIVCYERTSTFYMGNYRRLNFLMEKIIL